MAGSRELDSDTHPQLLQLWAADSAEHWMGKEFVLEARGVGISQCAPEALQIPPPFYSEDKLGADSHPSVPEARGDAQELKSSTQVLNRPNTRSPPFKTGGLRGSTK